MTETTAPTHARTRLSIRDMSLSFAGLQVLRSISLDIAEGITTGIIGPNGSGKTSLLNCVNGVYRPDEGSLEMDGRDLSRLRAHLRTSLGIARTFQHIEAPRGQTVLAYVMLGRYPQVRRRGVTYAGLGLSRLDHSEARDAEKARDSLSRVGMSGLENREIGALPYGLVKRIDLARALASDPCLLLLDEPAAGLSVSERRQLVDVLQRLHDQRQTICLIGHDMGLIASVCDRIVVMSNGQKVADGDAQEVMRRPDIRRSFLGE